MAIYLETYGCTMNHADSQIIKALLKDELTDNINQADLIIINSCGVKGPTEHKIKKRIKEIKDMGTPLIVAGCLPKIADIDTNVVGTNVYDIADAVNQVKNGDVVNIITSEKQNKLAYPRCGYIVKGIIPISEGCLGSCTYCAARLARGSLYSYPLESVMSTANHFIANGCKELQITSQDTGCYGKDLKERLPGLLENVASIPGKFKMRVGMMNPNHALDILDDLINVYHNEKIYKFLHVPVQSGNNEILKKMNRKYTIDEFVYICNAFKKEFPHMCIWTDIIVGFPTETHEQFYDTLKLVKKAKPDKINVTRFSPRPGTKAANMPHIPGWIKKERSRALHKLRMDISYNINKKYLGKSCEVLITKEGSVKNTMVGRTFNYKPVICHGDLGEFKQVTINKAKSTYLMAL